MQMPSLRKNCIYLQKPLLNLQIKHFNMRKKVIMLAKLQFSNITKQKQNIFKVCQNKNKLNLISFFAVKYLIFTTEYQFHYKYNKTK